MTISILIFGIVPLVTGSTFTYHKRFETNDDKLCHVEDTVLTKEKTDNDAKCLSLCSLSPACRSIFVNTDLNLCYGCSRMYDDPTGLPSLPGTKHFEKPVTYMEPCTIDRECVLEPNQTCNVNICTCKPGFPFDKSSNSCVSECAVYGSDFQAYPQKSLNIATREVWLFSPFPGPCMAHCASQSWCRGFDHNGLPTATCWFKDESAAANPGLVNFHLFVYHYSRNCA